MLRLKLSENNDILLWTQMFWFHPKSVPGSVVREALTGDIIPVINNQIVAEYEEVLRRPKFDFKEKAVQVLLDDISRRAIYAEVGMIEDFVPDPKDVVFYAVLMEERKEKDAYLVTGNIKHYPVRTYVVTPREMLNIVEENRT